jgi:hypothetical protein
MYKLSKAHDQSTCIRKYCGEGVILIIPFAPDNTDYAQFKKDILDGAELQNTEGDTMTVAEAKAYIATLP